MPETQNIEYKTSWRDEFLREICGFANAQGGTLIIGKNDKGEVVGLQNVKRLLEDIPNKIKDILGIIADVNLHQTEQGEYLEIIVEPQPNPVNYKGEYHFRSGSTKQELKGTALDKFLLKKQGRNWDSVLVPNVSVADLKQETFDFFRKKGVKSKRLADDVLTDSNEPLLKNLKLTDKDNGYLKRAALLLFHPDPEDYVTGAYIKIGYFESDSDLIFKTKFTAIYLNKLKKPLIYCPQNT